MTSGCKRQIAAAAFALLLGTSANAQDAAHLFGADNRVEGKELAEVTGKADTAMEVRAQNTSTVSNNSVVGQSETGTISFDSTSFQNMAGLSLLSANTGNNVSINSSLNVNVSIAPQ